MKNIIIIIFLSVLTQISYSQTEATNKSEINKNSITIGILQGGGSLIGMDIEALVTKRIGVQFGMGFIGYGAGINYHFKPTIRSSFISFQYWHQGIGKSFTQSVVSGNFVYRGKKWLTFQLGLGATLDKGPAWPEKTKQTPVILTYAIGGYIPI